MKNVIKRELIKYMEIMKHELDLPKWSFTDMDAEYLAEVIYKKIIKADINKKTVIK